MQDDGNLTLLHGQPLPDNGFRWEPIWATGTPDHPGTRLQLQFDGNVVLVAPGEVPIWATGTPTA